jgi:hypothetical protein
MKIFVSYTMLDRDITTAILKRLDILRSNHKIFIDAFDNDSNNKQERVVKELDSADTVLLIDTPNIFKSHWVKFELQRAIEKSIPISLYSNLHSSIPSYRLSSI